MVVLACRSTGLRVYRFGGLGLWDLVLRAKE